MNQHDILKRVVADVGKGQTNMSYKGELQTLTKLSLSWWNVLYNHIRVHYI